MTAAPHARPAAQGAAPPGSTPAVRPEAVLVRLKWRLAATAVAGSDRRRRNLVASVAAATVLAAVGAWGAAAAGRSADGQVVALTPVLVVVAVTVAWIVLPVMTFGTDETLDPDRLVLYPIEPQALMRGLAAASLIGVAPAAATVALAGFVVGYGRGLGLVVVAGAVAAAVGFAVTASRAVTTLLADQLRSRRGRDAAAIASALLLLGAQGVRFLRVDGQTLTAVHDVVRWTPPGMAGRAMVEARSGDLAAGVVHLLPALAGTFVLLRVWGWALDRSLTTVSGGQGRARTPRTARLDLPLLPVRVPFVPPNPWGAVASRDLRYLARDPQRKLLLVQSFGLGLVGALLVGLRASDALGPGAVLLSSGVGLMALLAASNQFGLDGGPLWSELISGIGLRDALVGRNVATVVVQLPAVALAAVVLAAFTGGWAYVPVALVVALAGFGAGLGVANVVSVRYPVRLREHANVLGNRGADVGCITSLVLLACSLVQMALLAPVAVATTLAAATEPWWLAVVAPAAALYGAVLWHLGIELAERHVAGRQVELLAAVDPRRGR